MRRAFCRVPPTFSPRVPCSPGAKARAMRGWRHLKRLPGISRRAAGGHPRLLLRLSLAGDWLRFRAENEQVFLPPLPPATAAPGFGSCFLAELNCGVQPWASKARAARVAAVLHKGAPPPGPPRGTCSGAAPKPRGPFSLPGPAWEHPPVPVAGGQQCWAHGVPAVPLPSGVTVHIVAELPPSPEGNFSRVALLLKGFCSAKGGGFGVVFPSPTPQALRLG